MKYAHLIPELCKIAVEAGKIIMGYYQDGFETEIKQDCSPVTEADIAAHNYILPRLQKLAPEITIISEEDEVRNKADLPDESSIFWLVDPLDGTKSFIKKTGEFTVNIGLIEAGKPTFGVVYLPVKEILYFTGEDGKAHKHKAGSAAEIINVQDPSAEGLKIVASASHRTQETDDYITEFEGESGHKVAEFVPASSSLKFCLVADGSADLYPRFGPTMEWDTAAAHAVLLASGGTLTKPDGSEFKYGKSAQKRPFLNGGFIAKGGF